MGCYRTRKTGRSRGSLEFLGEETSFFGVRSAEVIKMSILRIGSTGKYAQGWELAFGKKPQKVRTATKKKPAKKAMSARPRKKV